MRGRHTAAQPRWARGKVVAAAILRPKKLHSRTGGVRAFLKNRGPVLLDPLPTSPAYPPTHLAIPIRSGHCSPGLQMSEVFISYRQTSAAERKRVRAFAERLRNCGITVIFDQFYLEEHPGGPADGWDKWSSDRALNTEKVLIVGSEAWFQCFEKKQKPGTGLGAACEADDLRHRIYEAAGVIEDIRVVLFDETDARHIAPKLKRYHRFHAENDFKNIAKWLGCAALSASVTANALPSNTPHNLPQFPFFTGLHIGWTYNTTTLEGNTLSKAEVARVLGDPKAKIAKRPAEHIAAARSQAAAIRAVGKWLAEDRDFTKAQLLSLHTILMAGSTVDSFKPIGAWKSEDNGTSVRIDGKPRWNDTYAIAQHVPALMETWLAAFNKRREGAGDPFESYLWLHAAFVRIHPFADGNGRMARLLANVPILSAGHPPVDIPATARERYLAALARWQFACGTPRPNSPLYTKEGELKDFIALCRESWPKDAPPAVVRKPKPKSAAPAAKPKPQGPKKKPQGAPGRKPRRKKPL
jgi:fido (protein-threonine AMPylation protein)